MDAKTISAILLKVAGLMIVAMCVAQLPSYFPLMGRGAEWSLTEVLATSAISLGPLTVLGLCLWFFPGTIANRIVSGESLSRSASDVRAIELVALTVLGIYILTWGVIDVVRDVVFIVAMQRQSPDYVPIPASIVGRIAASVAQLIIGAWLCVGARGISRVVERLRGRES
jgi:hypothetical protein